MRKRTVRCYECGERLTVTTAVVVVLDMFHFDERGRESRRQTPEPLCAACAAWIKRNRKETKA